MKAGLAVIQEAREVLVTNEVGGGDRWQLHVWHTHGLGECLGNVRETMSATCMQDGIIEKWTETSNVARFKQKYILLGVHYILSVTAE
jgi:hypothetical protein